MRVMVFVFCFFVFACDDNKSLTPYLLESKEFKLDLSYGEFINSVSFLFITDHSGSMEKHRKHLAENIALFLDPLLDSYPHFNYNFAVTSAGVKGGKGASFLFVNTEHVAEKCSISLSRLRKSSQLGPYLSYGGSSQMSRSDLVCALAENIEADINLHDENFFKPIQYIAQQADKKFRSDFFGEDKILILFFISDAGGEEYVGGIRNSSKDSSVIADTMSNEILDQLKMFGVRGENIRAYAVIPPKKHKIGCPLDDTTRSGASYTPPDHVYSLIEKMEGVSLSICDASWGKLLTDVSDNLLQSIPSKTVYLEEIPKQGTVEVFFNNKKAPEDVETGWSLDIEKLAIYFGPNFDLSRYRTDSKFNTKDKVVIKYQPLNIDILQNSE
ncbi:MAG: hypothetical protein OXJ52_07040 [Oligoflexia bacterium]|nr:hypothetical protein [Oligoflexia bacterium]